MWKRHEEYGSTGNDKNSLDLALKRRDFSDTGK